MRWTAARGTTKAMVIAEWAKILKINYWPIFGIARSLLQAVPANTAADILKKMHSTASVLLTLNLGKSSDLSGVIFQRLISDRGTVRGTWACRKIRATRSLKRQFDARWQSSEALNRYRNSFRSMLRAIRQGRAVHNHFNQERHLRSRQIFKLNPLSSPERLV